MEMPPNCSTGMQPQRAFCKSQMSCLRLPRVRRNRRSGESPIVGPGSTARRVRRPRRQSPGSCSNRSWAGSRPRLSAKCRPLCADAVAPETRRTGPLESEDPVWTAARGIAETGIVERAQDRRRSESSRFWLTAQDAAASASVKRLIDTTASARRDAVMARNRAPGLRIRAPPSRISPPWLVKTSAVFKPISAQRAEISAGMNAVTMEHFERKCLDGV